MSSPIQTIAAALQLGHENCGGDPDSIWAEAIAAWPAIGEVIAASAQLLSTFELDGTADARWRAMVTLRDAITKVRGRS